MNLANLINEVLPLTGADYESDVVRHINKGLLNLAQESPRITRADIPTAADGTVSIPDNCLYVTGVYQNEE